MIGAGFGVLGVLALLHGLRRQRVVSRALAECRYAPLDERVAAILTGGAVLLAAAVVLVLALGV